MLISVPTRNRLQCHGDLDDAGQVGVVEAIGVADTFVFGTISRYSPPNEWPLLPVVKLVNDILNVPPTFASIWWTLHVKPLGGSHLAMASASRKARKTFPGLVARTRCRRTVLPWDMTLLSPLPERSISHDLAGLARSLPLGRPGSSAGRHESKRIYSGGRAPVPFWEASPPVLTARC